MQRMLGISAAWMLLALSCSPALPDWQFTKWGNSIEEVLAYKIDDMHEAEGREAEENSVFGVGIARARSNYRAGDIDTIANYLFKDGKLSGVALTFWSAADARRALIVLKSQYGMPVTAREDLQDRCEPKFYEWSDGKNGNFVTFNISQCPGASVNSRILYTPIRTASDTGL